LYEAFFLIHPKSLFSREKVLLPRALSLEISFDLIFLLFLVKNTRREGREEEEQQQQQKTQIKRHRT